MSFLRNSKPWQKKVAYGPQKSRTKNPKESETGYIRQQTQILLFPSSLFFLSLNVELVILLLYLMKTRKEVTKNFFIKEDFSLEDKYDDKKERNDETRIFFSILISYIFVNLSCLNTIP